MENFDELKSQYLAEIKSWRWEDIKKDALKNLTLDRYEKTIVGSLFLGTVFHLYPSGKCYAPWSTNVTEEEAQRDEAYQEALEEIANSHGMYVFSGEGDPCDVFVGLNVYPEDVHDDTHSFSLREDYADFITIFSDRNSL